MPLLVVLAIVSMLVSPALAPAANHPQRPPTFVALRESAPAVKARPATSPTTAIADTLWPDGTQIVHFENLEGMLLVEMTLRGVSGRDTTGLFVLDTGAGFLAVDHALGVYLGIADSLTRSESVELASSPLPRMSLGNWSMDQVQPVLTVDGSVVQRVTDRPVLGLLGQKPLRDRIVMIDYERGLATLIPARSELADQQETERISGQNELNAQAARLSRAAIGSHLPSGAIPIRFQLVGDGKILVRGRVADPRKPRWSRDLDLLVDTGATKCVLFEDAISHVIAHADAWPALRGLTAPTLLGSAEARIALVPSIELESGASRSARSAMRAHVDGVDAGVVRSGLSQVLSNVARTTIHGLVGYSFLKHFRLAIDYPNRVLWLDPIANYRDDRPFEYCHVGLQLERRAGAVIVSGVATGSPAALAGIRRDDEMVSMNDTPTRAMDLMDLAKRMEGPPGSRVTLVMRRGTVEHTHRLVRRRLL